LRLARIVPGEPLDRVLVGAVLTRDLLVGEERWSKGRRLSLADLGRLERDPVEGRGPWAAGRGGDRSPLLVSVLVPGPTDVHEDEAALRLAAAITGTGAAHTVTIRGPSESRVDILAAHAGELRIDVHGLEQLDRIDPIAVFTGLDGQILSEGQIAASVKVGPHLVPGRALERAEGVLRRRGRPLVEVRPFARRRVAALVRETLDAAARLRFEASIRTRIEHLGSDLVAIEYVPDDLDEVRARMDGLREQGIDIVLTAGAGSTDPNDPVFVALDELHGKVVSHGVPAHPGSMLWVGQLNQTTIIGLPTCGAYSRATAVDLLLPWLLAGEPPTRRTIARLGYGGVLTRDMRFKMPAYARELEAPEG
jgi:hypothetical protein